jgi:hypothetical protein
MVEWKYSPRILNLDTRWRWMVSFTPRHLHPQRKKPVFPLGRRLSGYHSRSRRGDEEKISQPCRESNRHYSVTVLTGLPAYACLFLPYSYQIPFTLQAINEGWEMHTILWSRLLYPIGYETAWAPESVWMRRRREKVPAPFRNLIPFVHPIT